MSDRSELEVKLPIRGMLIDERTDSTLEVVIPDSFRYVDSNPQGFLVFLFSPVKSLYYQGPVGAVIVVFILLVGGAFTAIRTGRVEVLEDCGHWLHYICSQEFQTIVKKYHFF